MHNPDANQNTNDTNKNTNQSTRYTNAVMQQDNFCPEFAQSYIPK